MSDWRIVKDTKEFRELVNINTGTIKRNYYCSDKQFDYINSLRSELNKEPLKHKPLAYRASSMIEKLKKKTSQLDLFS